MGAIRLGMTGTFDEVVDYLDEIIDRVSDIAPFWKEMADWWQERQVRGFGGDFDYKLNAPATLVSKRRKGQGNRPLIATGTMLRATYIDSPWNVGKLRRAFGIPKGNLDVRRVAILMQEGPRSAPPRNPVPPLTRAEVDEWKQKLQEYIVKEI